jgi:glycosyltransferase involved in cell wall biosynthesis
VFEISVVIAVLNAAAILPSQLRALREQDFRGSWELIICDNGSTDDLHRVVDEWSEELPTMRLVDASKSAGDGVAKRCGIEAARSNLVAICDADDVIAPEWLRAMYDGLQRNALVTGPLGRVSFEKVAQYGSSRCFDEVEFTTQPGERHGIPYAAGCNCGYRRDAIPDGFAGEYLVGSDGATSWRALRRGHSVGWVPEARVLFRERPAGQKSMRRLLSAGAAGMMQDREFADLFGRAPRFPFRGIGWCTVHAVEVVRGPGRVRWRFRFGTTLGAAIEYVAPGRWFAMQRRRRRRGAPSDDVASL